MLMEIDKAAVREAMLATMKGTKELADAAGVTPETINRIADEAGTRTIRATTLRKVAGALDVDPRNLIRI